MEKESILKDRTIVGSPLTHLFSLGILMFVFWLALSGDFAVKFVVYGLITSAVVAWICYPLLLLPNADGTKKYFALGVSPIAFLCYSMWLLKELVLANIDVVKATVRPELRIDPKVIRFVFRSDNPMAKVLLANSITLTPGTVTMNVTSEGIYEVHALTEGAAEGLLAGAMPRKVAELFGDQGPTVYDRMNGLGVTGADTILLIILFGYLDGRPEMYVDIAMSYALIGFVGSVIIAKYLGGKDV